MLVLAYHRTYGLPVTVSCCCNNYGPYQFPEKLICKELGKPESLITYVADRKGHDMRYEIDSTKIHNELGWKPETASADGLKKTVQWYLEHRDWWGEILNF